MEFILQIFHRVQAAEGGGRFAKGFSPRKLAEALQVKRSFLQMQQSPETHWKPDKKRRKQLISNPSEFPGLRLQNLRKPRGS